MRPKVMAYSEKFTEGGVIWFARLALHILKILGEPEAQDLQHSIQFIIRISYRHKRIRLIKVIPILQVRGRL